MRLLISPAGESFPYLIQSYRPMSNRYPTKKSLFFESSLKKRNHFKIFFENPFSRLTFVGQRPVSYRQNIAKT